VTEDQRMARDSAEPPKTRSSGSARWSDYLDWMRMILAVLALAGMGRHRRQ